MCGATRSHDPAGSDTRGAAAHDESAGADTLRSWVQQGPLDYIAPQIYWPFARDAALAMPRKLTSGPRWLNRRIPGCISAWRRTSRVNRPKLSLTGRWMAACRSWKKQLDLNETLPQIQGTILFRENNLNQLQTRQAVNYLRSCWKQPQS
ncbi:hypothetical protein MJK72_14490 [Klebsiella pneumoniae]|nr:hypothetical protein MJK72_14490 [Klebsiella pneumoniae]